MNLKSLSLKWLLLLALFAATTTASHAQWRVGVQSGATINSISTSSSYFYDRHYKSRVGFTVSVPVQYQFTDWFALQSEIGFIQKNYEQYRTGAAMEGVYTKFRNSYIEMPVLAHFSFGSDKLRGFTNLGAYIGGWVDSHAKGCAVQSSFNPELTKRYNFDEKIEFDSRRDRRFECGLLAGVGLSYQVTPLVQILAEGRYQYSLTDMQKNYMINQIPRYNNTATIQIGCLITISKKR